MESRTWWIDIFKLSMPDSKIYMKRYAYMHSRGTLFYQVLSVGYLCAGYLGYLLGFDISL